MAIIIPILFPMIFLCFSYDLLMIFHTNGPTNVKKGFHCWFPGSNKSVPGFTNECQKKCSRVYRTTNAVYGSTNADAGVGIGLKGAFRNLTKKGHELTDKAIDWPKVVLINRK